MEIAHIQREIEESLASLATSKVPASLRGLRHLPLADRSPRVSIRDTESGRKIRKDADASYFDPDRCEVVIRFGPSHPARGGAPDSGERPGAFDPETAMAELLDALREAERMRPFVGLKWFRDRFLPSRGYAWANDHWTSGSLLRRATDEGSVVTAQVPNPNEPSRPVTAIRIDRGHRRFRAHAPAPRAGFEPVRIRGASIADTVLHDRR